MSEAELHFPSGVGSAELRAEQRDQALAWLSDHWPLPQTCPICSSSTWNIGDIISAPLLDAALRDQWVSPYFPVTCLTCGFTHLFDAVVMGVLEGPTDPVP